MTDMAEHEPFATPRRQARAGLWIEGYHEVQKAYKVLGLYLIYVLFKSDAKGISLLFAVAGVLLFFILGFLRYRNVVFYIDAITNEFVFQDGVFAKRKTVLHIDRIQQVNISRNIIQKLLNVYSLTISSAGSKQTEIRIKALSLEDARILKNRLLSSGTSAHAHVGPTEKAYQFRLPNLAIVMVAVTSRYGKSFAILFAAAGALYNFLQDIFRVQSPGSEDRKMAQLINDMLTSVWSLAIFLFIFWILFNIISGVVRFYNYTVTFAQSAIQLQYGAIKTNHVIIYADKIQVIETISNYFQRKLNLRRLVFKQASADFDADQNAAVELPGCTPAQQTEIVSKFFPDDAPAIKTILPSYRKMFRPLINVVLIPLIIAVIFVKNWEYLFPLFAIWTAIASLLSYFAWKHSRLIITPEYVMVQKGAWDISVSKMRSYKIQGVRITQRLWHRRAGIAHLTLFTAADNLYFPFVKLDEVNPYINKWLYDVESTNEHWM